MWHCVRMKPRPTPTPTRNALNAITFLPGVNTAGVNRDSTINGLPESFVSITLDGVSNNDNFLRNSDGFFASVTPRASSKSRPVPPKLLAEMSGADAVVSAIGD